jgi:hypothetical protein
MNDKDGRKPDIDVAEAILLWVAVGSWLWFLVYNLIAWVVG